METTKELETIKQQSGSFNCGALRRSLSIYRSRSFTAKNKDAPRVPLKRSKTLRFFTTTVPKILYVTPESKAQPTAPLLIKDPPSSDNGSDLDDIKTTPIDPTHLNGSSGNFGSTTGPRSAPSTPQQQQQQPQQQPVITPTTINPYNSGGLEQPPCTTPGCTSSSSPSIQRSPSHNLFSKCDKASLKHLSTSAPTMTAQAQLPEPPSPKTTKEAKVPTMLKNRQKKFSRHFPSVDDEKVLNYYSCALIGDILLQGHLYITKNYFAFYSNVFGYVTKLLIPMLSVEKITKEKTARIIPNAVGIATSEDKHVFGSLMSRDNTYRYMVKVWEVAQNASMLVVEPEIEPVQVSDSDSSETRDGESGRESPLPPITLTNRLPISDNIPMTTNNKNSKDTKLHKEGTLVKDSIGNNSNSRHSLEIMNVLKQNISKFSRLPRQSLILYATTLLLILLFLSAAVLLYRISKIQNRFSSALHDTIILNSDKNNNGNNANSNNKNNNNDNNDKNNNKNDEIYNNLYQWQTHLHTKSAGAVHNFLDTNLDQIAKVRQSLEALSALLTAAPDRQQEPTNS